MKQRGRKSAAKLSIVPAKVDERPTAPESLLPEEREFWTAIVNARPVDFFDDASIPLLKEYCRLTSQVELMTEAIEDFEPEWLLTEDGVKRYKMLAGIRDQGQGRMIALARSMRLTQQARYVPDASKARPGTKAAQRKIWQKD